jgi:hypothetical protein
VTRIPDDRRLASYDALVSAHLAWRAMSRDVPPAHPGYDAEGMEAARRLLHTHGKHIVDAGIVRMLARVYEEGQRQDGEPDPDALGPANGPRY